MKTSRRLSISCDFTSPWNVNTLVKIQFIGKIRNCIDKKEYDLAKTKFFPIFLKSSWSKEEIDLIYPLIFDLLPHIEDLFAFEKNIGNFLKETESRVDDQCRLAICFAEQLHKKIREKKEDPFKDYKKVICWYAKAICIATKHHKDTQELFWKASEFFVEIANIHLVQSGRFKELLEQEEQDLDAFQKRLEQIGNLKRFCRTESNVIENLCIQALEVINKINPVRLNQEEYRKKLSSCIQYLEKVSAETFIAAKNSPVEKYWKLLELFREDFDEQLSTCQKEMSVKKIRQFQKERTEQFRSFCQTLLEDTYLIVGKPLCFMELCPGGSFAREEICPYSDLEELFLVGDKQHTEHCKEVAKVFELQCILLGETANKDPHHFRAGFHIDPPGSEELPIETAESLASYQRPREFEEYQLNDLANSLRSIRPLTKDSSLFIEYQKLKQEELNRPLEEPTTYYKTVGEKRAFERLKKHLGEKVKRPPQDNLLSLSAFQEQGFKALWITSPDKQRQIDIKTQYMEPLNHLLNTLALYFAIPETNTLDLIDKLVEKGLFTKNSGLLLKETVAKVYMLRVRVHLASNEQVEQIHWNPTIHNLTLLKKEKDFLLKAYWFVLTPLYTQIEEVLISPSRFSKINLIDLSFEQILKENSEERMEHFASLLCEMDAPEHVKYYQFLSSSVDKEPLRAAYLQGVGEEEKQVLLPIPNRDGLRRSSIEDQEALTFMLRGMSSLISGPVKVKFASSPDEVRFFSQRIAQLFLEGNSIRKDYPQSRHNVASFQTEKGRLHVKENPDLPLIERAAYSLFYRIMGKTSPAVELARIEIGSKVIPVLFSETIEGEPLEKISNLDPKQLSWLLLSQILMRPGDAHLGNFVVKDNKLYSVDNEVTGAEPITRGYLGRYHLHFCSALFCLDPDFILDREVIQAFCKLDIFSILAGWLDEIVEQEKKYVALFSQEELKTFYERDPQNSFTPSFLIREGTVTTINMQFNHLKREICTKPNITALSLLEMLISFQQEHFLKNSIGPLVATKYQKACQQKNSPKERYEYATGNSCSLASDAAMRVLFEKVPTFEQIQNKERLSAQTAREEIFVTQLHFASEYLNLNISSDKKSIQGTFERIQDIELEKLLLRALQQTFIHFGTEKPTVISLHHCKTLNRNVLLPFLHEELTYLSLEYCSQIDDQALIEINQRCPHLRTLSLKGCSAKNIEGGNLFRSQPLTFSKLEIFDISECADLVTISLIAPELQKLVAASVPVEFVVKTLEAPKDLKIETDSHFLTWWVLVRALGRDKMGKTAEEMLKLNYLDLSCNELTSLPPEIGKLYKLKKLDLSHNKLTSVPTEIGKLTNLTQLKLYQNQLTSVPPEIDKLHKLTELYLSYNQLTSIPTEIGKLTDLNHLYLSSNQLTSVPAAEIGKLYKLKKLDLESNQLTSVPTEIGKLTDLNYLYLSYNQLTSVPPEIGKLYKLKKLDLRGNGFTSIPPELKEISQVVEI